MKILQMKMSQRTKVIQEVIVMFEAKAGENEE